MCGRLCAYLKGQGVMVPIGILKTSLVQTFGLVLSRPGCAFEEQEWRRN